MATAWNYIRQRWQAYTSLTISMYANTAIGYVASWNVVLFQRRWGWGIGDIGLALGLTLLVCGPLGTMIGGALSDRLARVGHNDSAMRVTVVSIALMAACSTLYPIISTPSMMLLLFAAAMLAAAAAAATGAVALITLSPNQIRAQATALYWIVKKQTGLLLGPV